MVPPGPTLTCVGLAHVAPTVPGPFPLIGGWTPGCGRSLPGSFPVTLPPDVPLDAPGSDLEEPVPVPSPPVVAPPHATRAMAEAATETMSKLTIRMPAA
jgi:hypothetical protein